ncbi:MAG TPA: glycosyltransferase [Burkholderiales bacterium]|nr:glycosyltransferase [Burkholderiales bacterium]
MPDDAGITLSIVSHRHNAMVGRLLEDIERHCGTGTTVILTENVADSVAVSVGNLSFPIVRIANTRPKGFGANHNAAFACCHTPLFCVLNPDVRFAADPLPALSRTLEDRRVGVVGPLVRNSLGIPEDSARQFPTLGSLLLRALHEPKGPAYATDRGPVAVDWIAGMFMLFRREAYETVGGFDEAYFLYYEDVDICRRLRARGFEVVFNPGAEIIHEAQRASRGNARLAFHHLSSVLRYLTRRP